MKKKYLFVLISVFAVTSLSVGVAVALSSKKNSEPDVYHIVSFDTNGGTEINNVKIKHGNKLKKPKDPQKTGFLVEGWYLKESRWDFNKYQVVDDMTLKTHWYPITYTITYNFNGGETTDHYNTTYTINSEFDLVVPTKAGNVFVGWFNENGDRVDSIVKGMYGNLVLTAEWLSNLSVTSLDTSRGNVVVRSKTELSEIITVESVPVNNKFHLFKGWYDANDNLLSIDNPYTFSIDPNVFYTLNAKYMNDEEEIIWNIQHGVLPSLVNNVIKYGFYPQSVVDDERLIDELSLLHPTAFNNYYYFNHEYYSKHVAKLEEELTIAEFDNGQEIIEGNEYWFKVEPLSWRILSSANNSYTVLSEKLIEKGKYYLNNTIRIIDDETIYSNNYKYSSAREWLNNDFLSISFFWDISHICDSVVDNSESSTAFNPNRYVCEDTIDKVYLLSYQDYTNTSYGFEPDSTSKKRLFKTTDYVRTKGVLYSCSGTSLFNGYCWTRSPVDIEGLNEGRLASRNNMNGTLNYDFVGNPDSCYQPAMTIVLN